MFEIEYKGGNTVVLATKKSTLISDPNRVAVGLDPVVLKGAIEVATEERFASNTQGAQLSIEGPGEYEVGDFSIRSVAAQRHIDTKDAVKASTIYSMEVSGIRVAIIGNVDPKLSDDQLEAIGVVDILVLPVGGGGYTLDATSAASLVRQIEPKAVIPVHYAATDLKYEVPQDELEVFTKELGAPVEQVEGKYKLKSSALLPDALTVVVLSRT